MTTTASRTTQQLEERRDVPLAAAAPLIRADEATPKFFGHAAVFNQRTAIGDPHTWWGFYEEIDPGAFDETLKSSDARFLVDHDTSLIVARQSAGDLRLSTDDVGLAADADLDLEVTYIRDLRRNVERQRITGMSFGFYVRDDAWTTEEEVVDGKKFTVEVRRILNVELLEVSAVTFPAFPTTDAGLRSVANDIRSARGVKRRNRFFEGVALEADLLAARYRL